MIPYKLSYHSAIINLTVYKYSYQPCNTLLDELQSASRF
jgi:hypothetical protein